MIGFFIALLSGSLMSIQGVFNTQVTKTTGVWVSNGWVQLSAFAVCFAVWLFTGRDSVAAIAKPVQIYLRFMGYDADRSDEYFSQASSSALAQFQRDQGLEADGVIDNETAEALVNAAGVYWNEHEEELDTQKRKAVEIIHGREAV